jgi:hypothetical protein
VPLPEFPPVLAWDFYPNGITREDLLALLPGVTPRTGFIWSDETWSGAVHITGDVEVLPEATVTVEPGTVVFMAARSDDQHSGVSAPLDLINPKDEPFDATQRVELWIHGGLVVQGTREQPVIFTSDAAVPVNDDWGRFQISPGASVDMTRAIVEFYRVFGIGSSDVVIRQSILRNTMEAGATIGYIDENTDLDFVMGLTPTLTQNYIYNTGRNAITVRAGSPTLTHNIIRARQDLDTTGWEQGAIALDFPTCAVIHHNYLDGSDPRPYDGEVFDLYYEYTVPQSASMAGICPYTFEYNTLTGSPIALIGHPGVWSIANNNIMPVVSLLNPQPGGPDSWIRKATCIWAYDHRPAPIDEWQIEFLEVLGEIPLVSEFDVRHNYWGTANPARIENCLGSALEGLVFEYEPFRTEFIQEALPAWHEFEW